MTFLEIAFQAEVSRYEDPDFEEIARLNCNEIPENRQKAIDELRQIIKDRECAVRRKDDPYLLRYLRARRFQPERAFRLMMRYEDFRVENVQLYKGFNPFKVRSTCGIFEGLVPDSPDNGRITIMNFGKWNPSSISIEELTQIAVAMNEICIMQPKIQVLGGTAIIDLKGLSLRHVRSFTPAMAKQMVCLLGAAFPVHVHGIHVINYSWVLNTALYLFKPFIPADAWDRVHFHGSNVEELHKFIKPCYLPKKYGGNCQYEISADLYLEKIYKYKDEFLIEELKNLGYCVED